MATFCNEQYHKITGLLAAADLSSYQYYYVMINSSGTVALANAQTGGLGILLNKPIAGQVCEIAGPGSIVGAHCGGTTGAGDMLMVETGDAGKLIKATNGLVNVARALEAGADGSVTRVYVCEPNESVDVSKNGVGNA